MTTNVHTEKLRNRYREIDYVAELQKYWAYFNKWFKAHTSATTDRDGIEALKENPDIIQIIEDMSLEGHAHTGLFASNRTGRELYEFLSENRISRFVNSLWSCTSTRGKLNLFNNAVVDRIRGTGTISLDLTAWRVAYSHCRTVEAQSQNLSLRWNGMESLFRYKKITNIGSAYFIDSSLPVSNTDHFLEQCWAAITADSTLNDLMRLYQSTDNPGIVCDLLEMIYMVRNSAVHGDLDYIKPDENAVSRDSLFLLQGIIERII